jgi:hypothetical protein
MEVLMNYWPAFVFIFGIVAWAVRVEAKGYANASDRVNDRRHHKEQREEDINRRREEIGLMRESIQQTNNCILEVRTDVKEILKAMKL